MITMDEIESGLFVTHQGTGLRYSVVDSEAGEVLLSPEQDGLKDLTVAVVLFQAEFVSTENFRGTGGRKGRGGKTVTLLSQITGTPEGLKTLAKQLGRALGTGARTEGSEIILQGDVRERALSWLRKQGFPER